ncbi:hypothetical protein AGR6A_Lc80003 [Agrobacterium sp. NCPPB 925]|nr:hypothetical protein AGR6A_Lc80003 [Agrobacterium sp. NCPPB 925]
MAHLATTVFGTGMDISLWQSRSNSIL